MPASSAADWRYFRWSGFHLGTFGLCVEHDEVAAVAANRQACVGLHKAVDGNCPLLACSDRVNGKPRPGADVAADENVRLRGLIGQRVGLGRALLRRRERADVERAPVDRLADGADDGIDRERRIWKPKTGKPMI